MSEQNTRFLNELGWDIVSEYYDTFSLGAQYKIHKKGKTITISEVSMELLTAVEINSILECQWKKQRYDKDYLKKQKLEEFYDKQQIIS